MSRLFWVGVGAAATVFALRKSRAVVQAHTPPGVSQAVGIIAGLNGTFKTAKAEFSTGLAEREAQLRHDLVGDADLDAARTRTDEWRAQRRATDASRPGRHTDPTGPTDPPTTATQRSSAPQAQDPDDGELGYAF